MTSPLKHRNLPHLLLQTREMLMGYFRPILQSHGVTDQQWRILRALLAQNALEPRQLCEQCLISSPSITGVLMRMEEAGFISRERMDHDQRRVRVALTPYAKKMSKNLAMMIDKKYTEIEELVGANELQQTYETLDKLLTQVKIK